MAAHRAHPSSDSPAVRPTGTARWDIAPAPAASADATRPIDPSVCGDGSDAETIFGAHRAGDGWADESLTGETLTGETLAGQGWVDDDWADDGTADWADDAWVQPRALPARQSARAVSPGAAEHRSTGAQRPGVAQNLRDAASNPAAALAFARRHAAIVVVALVVAVGIAATHLFRAHSDAVPVSAVVASPSASGVRTTHAASSASPLAGSSSAAGATGATPAASSPANVTVQVLGPVRHPGVVTLRGGSRVRDALEACGGLLPGADAAELNLAAVLQDADQVLVGTHAHPRGEVRQGDASSAAAAGASGVSTGSGTAKGAASAVVVVDLNTASLEQLETIPGVGPVTAQRIVDWRTQHGHFSSPRELQEVDGIGPKSFTRLAPHVTV